MEPASSVGGDTFDYDLGEDALQLSITDAAGHDVAAALLRRVQQLPSLPSPHEGLDVTHATSEAPLSHLMHAPHGPNLTPHGPHLSSTASRPVPNATRWQEARADRPVAVDATPISPPSVLLAADANYLRDCMRTILDHFSRQLGALHDAFGDAPAALLQHVLDTYVHLYSAHFQHMRHAAPSQPLHRLAVTGGRMTKEVQTLRGAEADHVASLSGTYTQAMASLALPMATLDAPPPAISAISRSNSTSSLTSRDISREIAAIEKPPTDRAQPRWAAP